MSNNTMGFRFAGRGFELGAAMALLTAILWLPVRAEGPLVYEGKAGPGHGKHIVLLAGDEEYRSEECLPMLARILAERHGFKCTVLFSINPQDGTIDPINQTNVPGMAALASADLAICQFRFRELPDADMKWFADYLRAGKPVIALRTATHAFAYSRNKQSSFAKWSYDSRDWPGGFGQQVLGDTWINHHGNHGSESTRAVVDGLNASHPVLRGVKDVWGPTDVYGIVHLQPNDKVLLHGLTLKGMKSDDAPNYDKPLMPIAWIREYRWDNGNVTRAITSTIGAAVDFQSEDLRRLMINASFWLTGVEVPAKADATPLTEYKPSYFGFGKFIKGVKPADLGAK